MSLALPGAIQLCDRERFSYLLPAVTYPAPRCGIRRPPGRNGSRRAASRTGGWARVGGWPRRAHGPPHPRRRFPASRLGIASIRSNWSALKERYHLLPRSGRQRPYMGDGALDLCQEQICRNCSPDKTTTLVTSFGSSFMCDLTCPVPLLSLYRNHRCFFLFPFR